MRQHNNSKIIAVMLSSYIEQHSGGAELQASYICDQGLKKFDMQYLFLSNGTLHKSESTLKTHSILRKQIINRFGNVKFPYAFKILSVLRSIQPQFLYQRCGSALTGIAARYAKKNNCRFTFHIAHDKDVQPISRSWTRPWLIIENKLMQYGIRNADSIIAQTQFQAKELQKNYKRQAIVIPNGHPTPKDCAKTDQEVIILWIANWKPIKQPDVFIKLAKEIGLSKNIRFVMLGRIGSYTDLATKAKELGIEVLGEVANEQVNQLLSQSHILVNTSLQEGFSNTFIQAWMRRVPVISLHVNPDNVFTHKDVGYCSGSFKQLIQDTKKLIKRHNVRNSMGITSRQYAMKHHSLDNMKKIIKLVTTPKSLFLKK